MRTHLNSANHNNLNERLLTKADSTLSEGFSSAIDMAELVQQLTQLEDQVNHLLACQVFYDTGIRAMTCPEFYQAFDEEPTSQQ